MPSLEAPLTILVADDNTSDRMILKAIVRKQGYEVITAVDGQEAVELFEQHRPQIVLMDALMPRMDGFEATRRIKALAGEELVPVIFLTSLKDAHALADCLEAGGDDFLSKPYNQVILQAKINAFNRMRKMHQTLQQQRDEIVLYNKRLLQEQHVAKKVFDNVAHAGCLHASNIRFLLSPLAVFNGDVLLAARTPSGGMHVLLGDFTGHGLPAAIGAMPLAEMFYVMSAKGYDMKDILREINGRLKSILPTGFFCCAVMADFNFQKKTVEVWNGGLPDCLLLRPQKKQLIAIASRHLPLGVIGQERFNDETQVYQLDDGDQLFIMSDGVLEARNQHEQMFGENRVRRVLRKAEEPAQAFDQLCQAVARFVGQNQPGDDLTLLSVRMCDLEELSASETQIAFDGRQGALDWAFSYELRPLSLMSFNPLPLLLGVIMEVPHLRRFNGQIYTILAELFSNALEHGLLKLQSSLKQDPAGFARYYQEREKRLRALEEGCVRFDLEHRPNAEGGCLSIKVSDSGDGFDYESLQAVLQGEPGQYSGRGLKLLRSLCHDMSFSAHGNVVELKFAWQHEM